MKLGLLSTKFLGNPNNRFTLKLIWCDKILCYTTNVTWLPFHFHVHLYKIFQVFEKTNQTNNRSSMQAEWGQITELVIIFMTLLYILWITNCDSFLNQSKLYIYVFKTTEWEIVVIQNFMCLFWCHVSQNMT